MRLVCALVAMLGLLAAHAAEAAQPRKLALVIGNDLYSNFVPLERAVADSRAYRDMLSQTRGFEVFYTENADRAATFQLVFQFISNIRPGDTAMVVYSGHGVQLDPDRRDSLFLLPIDIPNVDPGLGAEEAFLSANGIRFSDISGWVKERGAKLSIFVLDACRNNPFTNRSGTRSVGLSRGLGRVDASEGEFVFFAAAPGEVALDRLPHNDDNPNSVFTRSFLKHFKPNTYLEDVANNVQEEVLELSRLANYRQAPYYTDGVAGKACLDDSCSVVAPLAEVAAEPAPEPATALNADVEETFWRLCETRDNPAYCEAYIQQYPEGPRALLAQVRLAEIRASEQLASRTPAVRADPSAKPAEEERRRAAEAETLAAEIEARRRAEAEAAQLREERAAKIERLEQELAARRDAEAEAARLLAEIEARRQAEEEAKTAALAASATVPQPELASATTPGFVPAPEPAEPAAPIATGDEGDKGLVIAALPTNRVEPPEPASPPTPSDAAFVPTLSDVDRQRAALWRALALSFDLAAIQSFADDHRRTAEGEAAAERVAVLKRLHREGQQQLNRSGYWAGTPDGIWGPRSARALRRFEKAQGLSETGVLTDALLARLRDMPTKRAAQPKRTPSASASRQSSGGGGTAASQPSFKPVTDPAPAPTASAEPAAPAPDPAPARPSPSVETDWEPFNDHSSM